MNCSFCLDEFLIGEKFISMPIGSWPGEDRLTGTSMITPITDLIHWRCWMSTLRRSSATSITSDIQSYFHIGVILPIESSLYRSEPWRLEKEINKKFDKCVVLYRHAVFKTEYDSVFHSTHSDLSFSTYFCGRDLNVGEMGLFFIALKDADFGEIKNVIDLSYKKSEMSVHFRGRAIDYTVKNDFPRNRFDRIAEEIGQ